MKWLNGESPSAFVFLATRGREVEIPVLGGLLWIRVFRWGAAVREPVMADCSEDEALSGRSLAQGVLPIVWGRGGDARGGEFGVQGDSSICRGLSSFCLAGELGLFSQVHLGQKSLAAGRNRAASRGRFVSGTCMRETSSRDSFLLGFY